MPDVKHLHIHEALQAVYAEYAQYFGGQTPIVDPAYRRMEAEGKNADRADALNQYGYVDVITRIYHGTRTYSARDYVTLISTYSDHKAIPEAVRMPFLQKIEAAIDRRGGAFALADIMLLCMGRKA